MRAIGIRVGWRIAVGRSTAECENGGFVPSLAQHPSWSRPGLHPSFSRSCRWMPYTPADARFMLHRAAGLLRRGWLSLRTRGLRSSLARAREQLAPPPAALREGLYLPPATPFAPFSLATSEAPV